jgi:predicted regulator of Ras-like GTPase activity (Roadblock/LC7/MglB family)
MAADTLSPSANRLRWLITGFVERTPGVAHAAVVSSDGLPLVAADTLMHDRALELAAITAGLHSIAKGASELTDSEMVRLVKAAGDILTPALRAELGSNW